MGEDTPTGDTVATETEAPPADVLAGIKDALATLVQAVDALDESIVAQEAEGEEPEGEEEESTEESTEETSTGEEDEEEEEEKSAE